MFSCSGVRQSVWRGSAPSAQTVKAVEDSLRPCGRLHLRVFGCFRLPPPAPSAVVGARQGHGRRCGRHRSSRTVEAGAKHWVQCHEACSRTRRLVEVTSLLPRTIFVWMLNVLMVTTNIVYIHLTTGTMCESILGLEQSFFLYFLRWDMPTFLDI